MVLAFVKGLDRIHGSEGKVGEVTISYARSFSPPSASAISTHLIPNSPAVRCAPGPPLASAQPGRSADAWHAPGR